MNTKVWIAGALLLAATSAQADLTSAQVKTLSDMGFSPEAIVLTLMVENDMTADAAIAFAANADGSKDYAGAKAAVSAAQTRVMAQLGKGTGGRTPGSTGGGTSGGGGGTAVAEAVQDVLDGTDN